MPTLFDEAEGRGSSVTCGTIAGGGGQTHEHQAEGKVH